jgi:hypothetical protein
VGSEERFEWEVGEGDLYVEAGPLMVGGHLALDSISFLDLYRVFSP